MRLFIVLTLCFFAGLAIAQERITLPAQNRPLREVLAELEKQTGYGFVPVGDVGGRSVTVTLENVTLHDALRRLRRQIRCVFLPSRRTFFVVPILTPSEIWTKVRKPAIAPPESFTGTLLSSVRTPWGWQQTMAQVAFKSPDRLQVETFLSCLSPQSTSPDSQSFLWSDGQRTLIWDKQRRIVTETPSPLWEWVDGTFGVHAVPAFGHGWQKLKDWQPTDSSAALVAGTPTWVLELSRRGSPPTQVTFALTRVALPGTIYAPFHEPLPVAWRLRCFLDCETLTLLRREVYDPRGQLLQIITATGTERNGDVLLPKRFEVLDGSRTIIANGEWTKFDLQPAKIVSLTLPADVLVPESPVSQLVTKARKSWLDHDDAATATKLLAKAVVQTGHPVALTEAIALYAQMNKPKDAWACLQKMKEQLWEFPEAITLAMSLANTLHKWETLQAWLQDQAEKPSPAVWIALAQLSALRAWQQGKETTEPMKWYGQILKSLSNDQFPTSDVMELAWEAAQRLFVIAWRFGRLGDLQGLALSLLGKPAEPIGQALLCWLALERGDGVGARLALTQLRDRFPDLLTLRLAVAELVEAYGFGDLADEEYRAIADAMPLSPESKRAQWHFLRRLVETDRAEEAICYFLDGFPLLRNDWTRCGWASEFRQLASMSLRHNLIAQTAELQRRKRPWHPSAIWLHDLMAHFSESEGYQGEALDIIGQAVTVQPKSPFFASRWCQVALRAGKFSPMDDRLKAWRFQFARQPFFELLFIFIPNLQMMGEENPARTRQLAKEAQIRAAEWRKAHPKSTPEGLLIDALSLLNHAANWLERPSEVKDRLLRLERVHGERWHELRHLARQIFIAFNGFRLELKQLLPFLDEAMESCRNEVERLVIAQNAMQVLVQRQRLGEGLPRLHSWLSEPSSDLYRRSLLLAWRVVLMPLLSDERQRSVIMKQLSTLPDDAIGWVLWAEAFEAMEGTDKAKDAYRRALGKANDDWLWQLYGEAAMRWKDYATAEKAFAQSVRKVPTLERAVFWLQARLEQGRLPDAETIRQWLVYFGWHWQLLAALASVSETQNAFRLLRLAERFATFDATIERERLFNLRLTLARSAIVAGQYQLARFWLERFLQPEVVEKLQNEAQELFKQLP